MRALRAGVFLSFCACGVALSGFSQSVRLAVTTPAHMVDCQPVTLTPCMSAGVTPVDAAGKAVAVSLPGEAKLAEALTLQSGSVVSKPFYAQIGSESDNGQRTSVVLILVDISGSMNDSMIGQQSRFDGVKQAIGKYLDGMQEGSDRVAVVPFESHNVISTIRAAVFTSKKSEARAQLDALPRPSPRNNTALYQAVFSGIDSIKNELDQLRKSGYLPQELQPHLIVMTDGRNEVVGGDDPYLLNGPLGLQQVVEQVKTSAIDVLSIGFGDRLAVDSDSLQRMSTRFTFAQDANQLLDALHATSLRRPHEILFTTLLPASDRTGLVGADQYFNPTLTLSDKSKLTGDPIRLIGPVMAAPVYQRRAASRELDALIAAHAPTPSGWYSVMFCLIYFAVALLIICVLWFWIPRIIWGNQYDGDVSATLRKWSQKQQTQGVGAQGPRSADSPESFGEEEGKLTFERKAGHITQIQPRTILTRSRLMREGS